VIALLQANARLVALKRLGVLLFVLAATLCASSTASALEPAQTKTRVWGFDFAEHNSDGLLGAANSGKYQGNRSDLSEVASSSLLAAEGAFSPLVEGGGLAAHEAAGGHLLAKHVGQAESALAARLAAQPGIPAASTFLSRAEAEAAISNVMAQRSGDIASWVANGANGTRAFDGAFSGGSVLVRGASSSVAGNGARVVLRGSGGGGYFILTGFPLP
jgi:hypothetical protein